MNLVNHIPNCALITNKIGLLLSLRDYERHCLSMHRVNQYSMDDFVPKTYIIDDFKERIEFFKDFKGYFG